MGTYSDWEREYQREEHVREEYRDLGNKQCSTCEAWSQRTAEAPGSGPLRALCENPQSPLASHMTTAQTTCSAWRGPVTPATLTPEIARRIQARLDAMREIKPQDGDSYDDAQAANEEAEG